MAAFPNYVKIGWKDSGEEPASAVLRSEMDRGVPKQRRNASDVLVQQLLVIYFDTALIAANYETWFYTTLNGGVDWFDFTSLRSGGTVSARFVGGQIGKLVPINKTWAYSMRQAPIEWLRSAT